MGWAICAHYSGPVDGECDIQMLNADVMDQLIVGALQKGRIDRDDRLHTIAGGARRKCQGMLFRNSHIKVALRVLL